EDEYRARKGWWNGINILAKDPTDILDRIYPPTLRDRTLYENEHEFHPAKYGFLAPEAVSFVSAFLDLRFLSVVKQIAKIVTKTRHANRDLLGRFPSMNTFSEGLPPKRFNSSFNNEDA